MAIQKNVTYLCELSRAKEADAVELGADRPPWILDAGMHAGFEWGVANVDGYRCGYVRIPEGHPWHGKDPWDMEPWPDVHRGIDYTASDTLAGWWLGFCCAHTGDAQDPSLSGRPKSSFGQDTIRSTAYVRAECRWLIRQAIDAAAAARRVMSSPC